MKRGYIAAYGMAGIAAFLIFYAAYVWMVARDKSEKLQEGLNHAYSLLHDDSELQIQLTLSISDIYTDALNAQVEDWLDDSQQFKAYIAANHGSNPYLFHMAAAVDEAHQMRAETIEDFKTYRAVINNSFLWLRTQESLGRISPEEGWIFHRMMDGFYTNDLEDIMPDFEPFGSPQAQQHMRILYDSVVEMNRITVKLAHTRTDGVLDKLIGKLEADLKQTERVRTRMMWSFVIGILLSLSGMILLYWRERWSFQKTLRLANDLGEFVDALNQSDIVSKADLQGRITFVNDAFCSISGYSREELLGKSHAMLRHPDTPSSLFTELWDTIRRGSIYKTMLKNRRKDGSAYYVNTTIVPLKNQHGEVSEYLAVRHDVSELVSARDHAIAAEKFKDGFLSNMSHELRTPLNGIIGFAHLLQARVSDPRQQKYLQTILESSEHLLKIINDILDLSKIKSDKFSLDLHPFELKSSFESVIRQFEAQATGKKLEFECTIPDQQWVNGDWLRISQTVTNLLSNAFKFTDEGGKVSLHASYADGVLECSVSDTGIGMDDATIARIFHAFEQADGSITRKYGGTGLGLNITKELVERMGGTIDVVSRVGMGTTFTIRIALAPTLPPLLVSEANCDEAVSLKGHVLVAEDNDVNLMLLTILLEDLGVTVTSVKDGKEAVDAFKEDTFDVILMDENMPDLSGTEAMLQIRRLPGGNLPIVALTANVMAGDRERFLESGMDDFIPKPINVQNLKTVLSRFLAR